MSQFFASRRFAAVMLCVVQIGVAQNGTATHYTRITNPQGWAIPKRSGTQVAQRMCGVSVEEPLRLNCFRVEGEFFVPIYFATEQHLTLLQTQMSASVIGELRVGSKVIGYTALTFGVHTAGSMRVWWVDEDGLGKFSDFIVSSQIPDLPAWVGSH